MSGAEIMGVLLDLSPEGREPPPPDRPSAEQEPGELAMLARGLLGMPRYLGRVVRSLPRALPNLEDAPILRDIPGAKTLGRRRARREDVRGRPSRVLERTNLTGRGPRSTAASPAPAVRVWPAVARRGQSDQERATGARSTT